MIVLDASVLVSVYWSDDAFHAESRAWLAGHLMTMETLHAPYLILAEVAGAITRRTNNPELALAAVYQIQMVLGVTLHVVEEEIGSMAARLAANLRLHGADATYVALAARLDAPLLTWDRVQLERGKQWVATRTPSDSV